MIQKCSVSFIESYFAHHINSHQSRYINVQSLVKTSVRGILSTLKTVRLYLYHIMQILHLCIILKGKISMKAHVSHLKNNKLKDIE